MTNIDSTLQERGERYGSFEHHAKIAQDLQRVLHAEAGWAKLADDQRQALTVIMDKVARMLNGDPAYRDNWHDIVGYAKLVDDRMSRDESAGRVAAADAHYALTDAEILPEEPSRSLGTWHPWHGGAQPVANNQLVDVKRGDAGKSYALKAEDVNWGPTGAVTLWRRAIGTV